MYIHLYLSIATSTTAASSTSGVHGSTTDTVTGTGVLMHSNLVYKKYGLCMKFMKIMAKFHPCITFAAYNNCDIHNCGS